MVPAGMHVATTIHGLPGQSPNLTLVARGPALRLLRPATCRRKTRCRNLDTRRLGEWLQLAALPGMLPGMWVTGSSAPGTH